MGKIDFPSIFRRKVKMSQDGRDIADALKQLLDEIEAEGIEISEAELEQRINEVCKTYGITPPKPKKNKPHTCTQCGAPIHDGKCDYCGTEYK